ncbi:MAG TPA: hypothetical protein VKA95_05340 [Nitrososphaeraceae archaeon]|nr:hypothetical protein [Nitrososphaeraceae archaeon]
MLRGLTVSTFGIVTAICLLNNVTLAQTTPQVNITEILIDNYPYVSVEYEDPSTVVIRGDEESLLLVNGTLAPFWEAIDKVKEHGYKLDDITTSGMGSQGNPTRFYAAMSK